MSAGAERWIKKWISLAAAVCLLFAAALDVQAGETVPVMEQYVTADAVHLYLKYAGDVQGVAAQIGTEAAEQIEIADRESIPIVTWLLLDNSISISDADRTKAKELLTNLVAGRLDNESFNLCTYDEHLNVILQDSQSYADLKSQIDAIVHNDQESYLTDVLDELLEAESARTEPAYVRVVVICDGVDNNPEGLTREELNDRLARQKIPVYTLGCETGENETLLKELYSLSRQTGALSWSLSGLTETLDVVKTMSGEEVPICATVSIPEDLRDGSVKGIQLTFSDGSIAETQAAMPFGQVEEGQAHVPVPAPTTEPEAEEGSLLGQYLPYMIAGGAVLLLAGIVVVVILLARKKRERQQIKPVSDDLLSFAGTTDLLPEQYGNAGAGGTLPLVGDERCTVLCISDISHPERRFEVPLRGRVSIGRVPSNQIVLDYERSISGTHCEIFAEGSNWKIRDLHSSNGTYLNGIRLTDAAELTSGSVLKLGRLELLVEIR